MNTKSLFSAALVTGSMLVAGAASAATLVTFNSAGNGVDTSATATTFQATGATGAINSTFTIAAATGSGVAWTENGTFQVTSFGTTPNPPSNPLGTVSSNILVGYNVFADINFSGLGAWGGFFGNEFNATSGTFGLTLRAVNLTNMATINLGTASLIPAAGNVANVTLVSGTAANTTLSGQFAFTPAAGTTGVGNFFEAPSPFNINFAVGNFGGNPGNTTYTVDPMTGVMSVFTPGPNLPAATGNMTFVGRVPEPGALALVGIALAGLGLSRRRNAA